MKRTLGILAISVTLILAAVVIGWLYFRANPAAWDTFVDELEGEPGEARAPRPAAQLSQPSDGLLASGTIEVQTLSIASELGGTVTRLVVSEGQQVTAGTPLLQLDQSALLVQREAAEALAAQAGAAVAAAEAQLALAQAGASEAELAGATGVVDAAAAGLAAAESQLDAAQGQLAAAEAQSVAADGQVTAAQGVLTLAEAEQVGLSAAQARAAVDGARANLVSAQANADAAKAMVTVAQANVATAQAGLDAGRAQLDQAQAGFEHLQAGAREQEIALLQANIDQAQGALASAQAGIKALDIQLERTTVVAPMSGIVQEQLIHQGELALPGATLFVLTDLEQATLTVYIPEAELGRVTLGQTVEVTVDAYDEIFSGHVSHIATQAEFTPKNIQTQQERVHMVFAVKIKLTNSDLKLKPGMPADAVLKAEP